MPGRVKDFDTIALKGNFHLITGGADGVVRIWDPSKDSEKNIHEVKVRMAGREGRLVVWSGPMRRRDGLLVKILK